MCTVPVQCGVVNLIGNLRSRSHSRERIARLSGGHRPLAPHHGRSPPNMGGGGPSRGGHVSVHSRLGAMPPPANEDPMHRELAERDMYMRDRERQASCYTDSTLGSVQVLVLHMLCVL